MPDLVTMKRFAAVLICLALCGSFLTGCGSESTSQTTAETVVESFSGHADVEGDVPGVRLEIRSGILYVIVYGGTYKTTIEADEISVISLHLIHIGIGSCRVFIFPSACVHISLI